MIEMKCCDILGTRILVTNMADTVERIEHDMEELRGKYICVGNVHTTVMAHDDAHYHEVQKSAAFVLPDGKPLLLIFCEHQLPLLQQIKALMKPLTNRTVQTALVSINLVLQIFQTFSFELPPSSCPSDKVNVIITVT